MKKLKTIVFTALFPVALFAQWQKIPADFSPLTIAVPDSSTIWSINFDAGKRLTKSTDGGQSWANLQVPNINAQSLLSGVVKASDANRAWVYFQLHPTYDEYLYRTTDGGATWTQLALPGNNASVIFMHFYDANNGLLMASDFSNNVFVRQTTDGGQTWTPYVFTIQGSPLGVTTYGDRFVWMYTGSGKLWRSTDNGAHWTTSNTGFNATSYGLAMAFRDSLNGIAAVDRYSNKIVKTADGGATWTPINTLPHLSPNEKTFVWGISAIPGEPEGWIMGDNEGTVFTLDDGDTWMGEVNYPDFDFRGPVFNGTHTAWSIASSLDAIFKWQLPVNPNPGCVAFLGPLTGKPVRKNCNGVWFEGKIRADISQDTAIHLRTKLLYPDNTFPGNKQQLYHNLQTGSPGGIVNFVPDPGETTIGEIRFEVPVHFAYDTSQEIICTISPTACQADVSNSVTFHTGYFANWFHPECFFIDTSDCGVTLITNYCGIDTNQYNVYYSVQGGPLIPGNHYEQNPSYHELVQFYIYVDNGTVSSSTCYKTFTLLYTCGVSGTDSPELTTQLKIMPNPSTGNFTISIDHLPADPVTITLRDLSGKTIRQFASAPVNGPIMLENMQLQPGIYLAEVWNGIYRLAVEKLVVLNE